MSWKASAWAKEQRLGSPAAKSIIMCLADYADPENARCWPSQAKLAGDAEVSERTAREWLQRLEEWGLIGRERRSQNNGARASDLIVLQLGALVTDGADRLRDNRAADVDGNDLPANSAGRAYRQPDTEPTGNEAQPTGNQFRAYKEEPSKEPPTGTSQPARQGAREGGDMVSGEESPKAIETAFWRVVKDWPRFAGMPKEPAKRAWLKLSAEERRLAERRLPGWFVLLKAQRKDHIPAPATYFGERLWQDVPDPQDAPVAPLEAKPFGKMWMAMRLARLMQDPGHLPKPSGFIASIIAAGGEKGARERLDHQARNGWPAVKSMDYAAASRASSSVTPEFVRLEPVAAGFEQVKVGGERWAAWKSEHEARGWPWLPDPGRQDWVYFPARGPVGLQAFEAAVRGGENDAGGREAAE